MDYMDLKSNENYDLFGLEIMPVNEWIFRHKYRIRQDFNSIGLDTGTTLNRSR